MWRPGGVVAILLATSRVGQRPANLPDPDKVDDDVASKEGATKRVSWPSVLEVFFFYELKEAKNKLSGNEAKTNLPVALGGVRPAWLETSAEGPSDLFRRTVDYVCAPFAKAIAGKGHHFSAGRFDPGATSMKKRTATAKSPVSSSKTRPQLIPRSARDGAPR